MKKSVAVLIAGEATPEGKVISHASAIISPDNIAGSAKKRNIKIKWCDCDGKINQYTFSSKSSLSKILIWIVYSFFYYQS